MSNQTTAKPADPPSSLIGLEGAQLAQTLRAYRPGRLIIEHLILAVAFVIVWWASDARLWQLNIALACLAIQGLVCHRAGQTIIIGRDQSLAAKSIIALTAATVVQTLLLGGVGAGPMGVAVGQAMMAYPPGWRRRRVIAVPIGGALVAFAAHTLLFTAAFGGRVAPGPLGSAGGIAESNAGQDVAANLPEFYEAFNVQPGDALNRAPEDRTKIW